MVKVNVYCYDYRDLERRGDHCDYLFRRTAVRPVTLRDDGEMTKGTKGTEAAPPHEDRCR